LLLVALAACGGSTAYRVRALPVPKGAGDGELAVCRPGVTLVPYDGGVVIAGAMVWAIPSGEHIGSIGCDEAGDVFYTREVAVEAPTTYVDTSDDGAEARTFIDTSSSSGVELVVRSHAGTEQHVPLPAGHWQLVSTVDPMVWLYDRAGSVLYYDDKHGLVTVTSGTARIDAAAAIGTGGLAAVIGGRLVAWLGTSFHDFGDAPNTDGLAVAPDGSLYLSMPRGIVKLHVLDGPAERIARGIHGPLRLRGQSLFVLWREHSTVLQLTKRTHHENIFTEGPAQDRRESIDFSAAYEAFVQESALHATDIIRVGSLDLAQPATLQGVSVGGDIGPMLSRHLVAETRFAFAFGSAPIESVSLLPGKTGGQPLMTSDLSYVSIGERIGVRIPFGYFSLRAGAGTELGFLNASGWREPDGSTSGTKNLAFSIPAWARLELETSCWFGVYAHATYDKELGQAPDQLNVGIGVAMRTQRSCY